MNFLNFSNEKKIALRKQAHHIKPVLLIGNRGLTVALLAEAERTLIKHQLIKIKVLDHNNDGNLFSELCQRLNAIPIQKIGKIFVIWKNQENQVDKNHLFQKTVTRIDKSKLKPIPSKKYQKSNYKKKGA